MSEAEKQWQPMRDEYLRQIEAELTAVHHPREKEVLDDVAAHLDRRFAELSPPEQTAENFKTIMEDMGPAEEYAELLKQPPERKLDIASPPSAFRMVNHLLTIIFLIALFSLIGYTLYTAETSVQADPMQKFILNFEPDPQVMGNWVTVDFVDTIDQFVPGQRQFRRELFLKDISFYKDMKTSKAWLWSKGNIFDPTDQKESRYLIKTIDGREYLFLEWEPSRSPETGKAAYYVLVKEKSL